MAKMAVQPKGMADSRSQSQQLILTSAVPSEASDFPGANGIVSVLRTGEPSKLLFRIHIMHGEVDFEEHDILFTDHLVANITNHEDLKARVSQLVSFLRMRIDSGKPSVYMAAGDVPDASSLPTLARGCRVQVKLGGSGSSSEFWISGKVSRVSEDGSVRVHAEDGARLKNIQRSNIRIIGKRVLKKHHGSQASTLSLTSSNKNKSQPHEKQNPVRQGQEQEQEQKQEQKQEQNQKQNQKQEQNQQQSPVDGAADWLQKTQISSEKDDEAGGNSIVIKENSKAAEPEWYIPYNILPSTRLPELTDEISFAQIQHFNGVRVFVTTFHIESSPHLLQKHIEQWIQPREHQLYMFSVQYNQIGEREERISDVEFGKHLTEEFQRTLGSSYWAISFVAKNGLYVCAMAHRSLTSNIHAVEWAYTPIGVSHEENGACNADTVPNGAAAVSFSMNTTSFLLVNAHFVDGQRNDDARNHNFHEVNTSLRLPAAKYDPTTPLVERFDHVIWAGDLNYKIDASRKAVDAWLRDLDFESMWGREQLRNNWKQGRTFQGYSEGPLRFLPTFKYDPQSMEYDTSAKKRIPSWTDRILWKKSEAASLLAYDSFDHIGISSHRPVWSVIHINLDVDRLKSVEQTNDGGKQLEHEAAAKLAIKSSACAVS